MTEKHTPSTNFRWHKKNFIADIEYLLYLLFLSGQAQGHCVACRDSFVANQLTMASITSA